MDLCLGQLYYSSSLYAKHLSVSLERFRASSTHIGQPELTWQYPLSEFWVLFQTNKDCLGKSISPLLQASMAACMITVDRESFTLRTTRVKNFVLFKFSWFRLIHDIFLTVDDCNMDECLEISWCLVYYQVSGEPGITGYGRRSDIYLGECGFAHKLIQWSSPRNFIFRVLNFRGWSWPWNYFNSEIFYVIR